MNKKRENFVHPYPLPAKDYKRSLSFRFRFCLQAWPMNPAESFSTGKKKKQKGKGGYLLF